MQNSDLVRLVEKLDRELTIRLGSKADKVDKYCEKEYRVIIGKLHFVSDCLQSHA